MERKNHGDEHWQCAPRDQLSPRDLLPQSAWTDLAAALATSTILKSNLPSKAPTYGGPRRVLWYSLQLLWHNPDYDAPTTMMHQLLVPTMHPPCFSLLLFLHQLCFRWKRSNLLPQWFLQNSVQMQRKEQNHLVVSGQSNSAIYPEMVVLGQSISAIEPRRVVLGQSIWVTFHWEL